MHAQESFAESDWSVQAQFNAFPSFFEYFCLSAIKIDM